MMRKAIIVDLEGVLLNIDYQKTFDAFLECGIKITYDSKFKSLVNLYDAGKISTAQLYNDFWQEYCLNIPFKKDDFIPKFISAWNAMLLTIPDPNIEYLFKLRQEGHLIILLSNINELHAELVNKIYGEVFANLFHKIFYSYQTHALKPTSESFTPVLEYLSKNGVYNKQMIFIDDSSENITAASRLNILAKKYPTNGTTKGIFLRTFLDNTVPLLFSKNRKHAHTNLIEESQDLSFSFGPNNSLLLPKHG